MEDAKIYNLLSLFFGVWHMEDAKMYDLLSLFFGVCHMEDAKMYDLLSLWHMEDSKMYDLLSLFWPLPLAYWKVKLRSCCSAYWGVNPALAYGRC